MPQAFHRSLTVTPVDHSISLQWSVPLSDGGSHILRYRLYADSELISETTSLFHTHSLLTRSNTYSYQISAVNLAGEGELSPVLSIVASQAPSGALNLVRTTFDSQTQMKFTWSAPLDDGGDPDSIDYKVYSDLGDQSAETEYVLLTASTGQLQEYTAIGLETAKTYFFKVVAFTLAAEGPSS
jgi:hypothetical protein